MIELYVITLCFQLWAGLRLFIEYLRWKNIGTITPFTEDEMHSFNIFMAELKKKVD